MSKILLILLGTMAWLETSIYSLSIPSVNGGTISFSQYQGKKILLVNIATGSSRVQQLEGLEQLYQQHKDSMVVIGVPSNSFGSEPLSGSELENVLRNTYGVTFPLAGKVAVAGDSAHAVYKWLVTKTENGVLQSRIKGDFQKYLLGKQGKIVGVFDTATAPLSDRIQTAIQNNH